MSAINELIIKLSKNVYNGSLNLIEKLLLLTSQYVQTSKLEEYVKTFIMFLPLLCEFYCLVYHLFIVRLWMICNLSCIGLQMYNGIRSNIEDDSNDITTSVVSSGKILTKSIIKLVSSSVIFSGVTIIFTSAVYSQPDIGIATNLLLTYLVFRLVKLTLLLCHSKNGL